MQGKCEKRCQDGANRPSNSLWEQIFCSGWGCYRERRSLQVSILQGKCEKRCQDRASRPSNSLWEPIFCSGWGCYRERRSVQVSILQGKCEKRRQDRENRPSNSLWEPILCEGQCGQQEHTVSCAQLPRVLNCCLVIAVMWAHCGDACHALGKTMPDETLARSRQKGKEKKEMK